MLISRDLRSHVLLRNVAFCTQHHYFLSGVACYNTPAKICTLMVTMLHIRGIVIRPNLPQPQLLGQQFVLHNTSCLIKHKTEQVKALYLCSRYLFAAYAVEP